MLSMSHVEVYLKIKIKKKRRCPITKIKVSRTTFEQRERELDDMEQTHGKVRVSMEK